MSTTVFAGPKRALAMIAAALTLSLAPGAAEAKWPEKPVRIVLPFGPGGVADVTARIMADRLSKKLGQQFVIENMPGPGGINAARTVVRAPGESTRSSYTWSRQDASTPASSATRSRRLSAKSSSPRIACSVTRATSSPHPA